MPSRLAIIPWYETKDDFDAVLNLLPFDEAEMTGSYESWVKLTENSESSIKQIGNTPLRVSIKPLSLKEWCENKDVAISWTSIANYAQEKATKK